MSNNYGDLLRQMYGQPHNPFGQGGIYGSSPAHPPISYTPPCPKPKEVPAVKKHGFLRSLIILIAAAYLAHKLWANREKIAARLEKIGSRLATKLGLD